MIDDKQVAEALFVATTSLYRAAATVAEWSFQEPDPMERFTDNPHGACLHSALDALSKMQQVAAIFGHASEVLAPDDPVLEEQIATFKKEVERLEALIEHHTAKRAADYAKQADDLKRELYSQ
jgi:uncharacterized small protein (DUF1192 family)